MNADVYTSESDFFVETNRIDFPWNMANSHYHNSYEIYYLSEGKRLFLVRDKIYVLDPGDIVLLKPNVFHRSMGETAHERFNIVFTEKTLSQYFTPVSKVYLTACFETEFIRLSPDENRHFNTLYERLKDEYDQQSPFFVTLADMLRLLCNTSKINKEPFADRLTTSKSSKNVDLIISYVIKNYNNITSVDEIAAACYLNKSYMCRLFKRATGLTVFEYLNNIKTQKACEMLRKSNDSITDIALKCGFSSASYFSYAFKETMSCTPSEFRRENFKL